MKVKSTGNRRKKSDEPIICSAVQEVINQEESHSVQHFETRLNVREPGALGRLSGTIQTTPQFLALFCHSICCLAEARLLLAPGYTSNNKCR